MNFLFSTFYILTLYIAFYSFIVQVLLDNFSYECKKEDHTIENYLRLIEAYEKFDNVFGYFFLIFFFCNQLFLIVECYVMFSNLMVENQNVYTADFVGKFGRFFMYVAMVVIMNVVLNSAENTFKAMKEMERNLQDQLYATEEDKYEKDLRYLIQKLEKLKPLSAAGYFDIQKGCLTSMFSVR